jgi:dUTP pyrophosphatase
MFSTAQCALLSHPTPFRAVKRGDRIAQLILERIAIASIEETAELEDTVRGAGGFGSTGVASSAAPATAAAIASHNADSGEKKPRLG